ncbi:HepT-like ribonuclease domain-containing protein [Desulfoscipio gibsoniae]|uniref:DUF86 domain-containing protein n=1 Tax=Desulfoscipio gibsoniae DSM 7213 TaxID=767817 RepID=R4KMC6_9FIRM|nr:DUF86 domain-containing protein [Desulfoscipio gibsoniae]AGL01685.1 hypothetical protein Desgi_2260 [Desulfoscipio gibsoniae DSM 7213]
MTRNARLYLYDILESIEKIQQYTTNLTFEDFVANNMAVDTVVRNFEIIGEAAKHIPDDIQSKYSEVPWFEMKGLRNIMVHEYFRVDLKIVWKTARESLPALLSMIKRIIADR